MLKMKKQNTKKQTKKTGQMYIYIIIAVTIGTLCIF